MKKNLNGIGILFFILMIGLVNLNLNLDVNPTVPDIEVVKPLPALPFEINEPAIFNESTVIMDDIIHPLYITVFDSKPIESVTIENINTSDYTKQNVYIEDKNDPFAYVHFSEVPVEGFVLPNATLEIRGQSARTMDQKSYKIKLFKKTDLWFNHRIINLNKHFEDPTRIKNKLSFDLFYSLKNMSSMETKFSEVFIKDLSQGMTTYVPYGLFTFIEQPNDDFIEKVYNDPNGGLYKAEFFEFYNYDVIKPSSDPTYDALAFENYLEIRGDKSHDKLKQMLIALNDYNQDINDVVDQYFDEDNMLTWLASNILLNNYDTNSRNFMLYNPTHTNKWYFLPWDYDKAWSSMNRSIQWQRGISNYWGMVIFNRYLKKEGNYEKFNKVFENVYEHLKPEMIKPIVSRYSKSVVDLIYSYPDKQFLDLTREEYDDLVNSLENIPLSQYIYYYDHIESPMPFYLGKPVVNDSTIDFVWDAAYDLQNDPLHYKLTISDNVDFINNIIEVNDIFLTSYSIPRLDPGLYYWRVDAYDDKDNHMSSFDFTVSEKGEYVFGAEILEIGGDEND